MSERPGRLTVVSRPGRFLHLEALEERALAVADQSIRSTLAAELTRIGTPRAEAVLRRMGGPGRERMTAAVVGPRECRQAPVELPALPATFASAGLASAVSSSSVSASTACPVLRASAGGRTGALVYT